MRTKTGALAWTEDEVIARLTALYPMSKVKIAGKFPKRERAELLATWRARLHDISWFMRGLNEHISRMANKEDKVRGRFWEGRFKSQALVDERGLLACMVYVDLNPVRAGLSDSLDGSAFTSIQERMLDQAKKREQHRALDAPTGMASFHKQAAESGRAQGIFSISFDDYVKLVRWTDLHAGMDSKTARDPRGNRSKRQTRASSAISYEVSLTPGAEESLEELLVWWGRNRTSANPLSNETNSLGRIPILSLLQC